MRNKIALAVTLACLLLTASARAQTPTQTGGTGCNSPRTYALRPVTPVIGTICTFNDALTNTTCGAGGVASATCRWNGTAWQAWLDVATITSENDPVYAAQRDAITSARLWASAGAGLAPTGVVRNAAGGVANYDTTCRSDGTNCSTSVVETDPVYLVDAPTICRTDGTACKAETDPVADPKIVAHIALTAAHGATGAVVGTTNTQTLTNKTLTLPTLELKDSVTPPVVPGVIEFDRTLGRIQVGVSPSGTNEFYPGAHTVDTDTNCLQAGTVCPFAGSATEGGAATAVATAGVAEIADISAAIKSDEGAGVELVTKGSAAPTVGTCATWLLEGTAGRILGGTSTPCGVVTAATGDSGVPTTGTSVAITGGANIVTVGSATGVDVTGQFDQVASVACAGAGDVGKYGLLANGVLSYCGP